MENTATMEQSFNHAGGAHPEAVVTSQPPSLDTSSHHSSLIAPQSGNGECSCGGGPSRTTPLSYVYALGRVGWRFPNQSVEKELAQATGRTDTASLTDRQAIHAVLSQRQNRYLARQLRWVLSIEGLDTYILLPRDPADLDLLIEAVRPAPSPMDVDVVVGVRGGIAPPELCNGLMVPMVAFEQIYSFDRHALIHSIPQPEGMQPESFTEACEEVFDRLIQMADNAGATDEHRALNYCAMRYPAIYAKAAEAYGQNCSMTGVEVRPSSLSGSRKICEVIFSYTHRNTDFMDKCFVRVDVTEAFPFLVTKLSPYYNR